MLIETCPAHLAVSFVAARQRPRDPLPVAPPMRTEDGASLNRLLAMAAIVVSGAPLEQRLVLRATVAAVVILFAGLALAFAVGAAHQTSNTEIHEAPSATTSQPQ